MIYVGIDLGTTNTLACAIDENGCSPIEFAGESGIPSVVLVNEDESVTVGRRAKNARRVKADRIIARAKPHMPNGKSWTINNKEYTPVDAAREVLSAVAAQLHEDFGAEQEIRACITVPACFSSAACEATKQAAREAGIDCVKLQLEPVAAAVAFDAERGDMDRVLVVDTGGGTFDLAVISSAGNERLNHLDRVGGISDLGGNDFDDIILDRFIKPALTGASSGNPQDIALRNQMLEDYAQQAKEFLQVSDRYVKSAVFRDGTSIDVEITQQQYLECCGELRGRMCAAVGNILTDYTEPGAIDGVVLVGGMANDPNVQLAVRAVLGDIPFTTPANFMSMVAAGAALDLWNSLHNGGFENTVTYTNLGIRTEDGVGNTPVFHVLIPRNTSISPNHPAISTSNILFTNTEDYAANVTIMVYETESAAASLDEARHYNNYTYAIRPMPRFSNRIIVTFELNTDRELTVRARDEANPEMENLCVRLNLQR